MPTRFLRPLSLRRWLFVLSMAGMVPSVMFAGYVVQEYDRSARQAILTDLEHRARDLQHASDQLIAEAAAAMGGLADGDSAQAGDWPALYEQAKRNVARNRVIRAVTLVDSDANVVFYTGAPYGAAPFKASDPESLERTLRTGKVSVSGAFVASAGLRPVVAVSVPIRHGPQIRYVLRAIVLATSVDELLAAAALPAGWVAGITDAKGVLLARSTRSDLFVGKPAAPSFFEGMRRADGRPFAGRTLEGILTTIMVLPVHGGDWQLGMAVPDSVLSAPLRQSILKITAFAVFWLGLALAMSYAFSSFLTRQGRALVEAITRPAGVAADAPRLKVREFMDLLNGVSQAQDQANEATGRMAQAIHQRDEVFDLYHRAPCGYHSLDADGRILRMNETALGWLGRRWEDVKGRPFSDLLTSESKLRFAECFPKFLRDGEIANVELWLVRQDGSTVPVSASATALKDEHGTLVSSRSTLFDITERKRLEDKLDELARKDPLTGLSNRRDFEERAELEVLRTRRHGSPLALLLIDVDHFKQVNDQQGHDAGDLVLQSIATTLRNTVRRIDLVARVGGEEFVALLPDAPLADAVDAADRLRRAVAATRTIGPDGAELAVTVSIGLTLLGPEDISTKTAMKRADLALYRAKHGGRNQVSVDGNGVGTIVNENSLGER